MGKVVENIVIGPLTVVVERKRPLSNRGFGSTHGLFALDAAVIMVDRSHPCWNHNHTTGDRLTNINAAFPHVPKEKRIRLMKVRKIGVELRSWTESFDSE
jgi:hypothetical protein